MPKFYKCPKCNKPFTHSDHHKMCKCGPHAGESKIPFRVPNDKGGTVGIMGWICPRCGKSHSPYVPYCDCPPQTKTSLNNIEEIPI